MSADDDRNTQNELIAFWFAENSKARWYDATDAFDQQCLERFGKLVETADSGKLEHWMETPEGALSLCLLLDQLPRNIYRATPKAFASDPKAVSVAAGAIDKGFDQDLDLEKRKFLYLPFMHSEVLAEQERSVVLSTAMGDKDTLEYAIEHAEIVRRFGRFPHRNAILGRVNSTEENAYLADGAKTYGQSSEEDS